jgi:hypothetical protein
MEISRPDENREGSAYRVPELALVLELLVERALDVRLLLAAGKILRLVWDAFEVVGLLDVEIGVEVDKIVAIGSDATVRPLRVPAVRVIEVVAVHTQPPIRRGRAHGQRSQRPALHVGQRPQAGEHQRQLSAHGPSPRPGSQKGPHPIQCEINSSTSPVLIQASWSGQMNRTQRSQDTPISARPAMK